MPWYKVDYHCGLSASQKGELAAAISDIHTKHFIAPKIFVNVQFQDISKDDIYVGGKPVSLGSFLIQSRCTEFTAYWA
jgi:phenylpyruvate tautomerase PptA (4-oxalocrotonate tautomerase family)